MATAKKKKTWETGEEYAARMDAYATGKVTTAKAPEKPKVQTGTASKRAVNNASANRAVTAEQQANRNEAYRTGRTQIGTMHAVNVPEEYAGKDIDYGVLQLENIGREYEANYQALQEAMNSRTDTETIQALQRRLHFSVQKLNELSEKFNSNKAYYGMDNVSRFNDIRKSTEEMDSYLPNVEAFYGGDTAGSYQDYVRRSSYISKEEYDRDIEELENRLANALTQNNIDIGNGREADYAAASELQRQLNSLREERDARFSVPGKYDGWTDDDFKKRITELETQLQGQAESLFGGYVVPDAVGSMSNEIMAELQELKQARKAASTTSIGTLMGHLVDDTFSQTPYDRLQGQLSGSTQSSYSGGYGEMNRMAEDMAVLQPYDQVYRQYAAAGGTKSGQKEYLDRYIQELQEISDDISLHQSVRDAAAQYQQLFSDLRSRMGSMDSGTLSKIGRGALYGWASSGTGAWGALTGTAGNAFTILQDAVSFGGASGANKKIIEFLDKPENIHYIQDHQGILSDNAEAIAEGAGVSVYDVQRFFAEFGTDITRANLRQNMGQGLSDTALNMIENVGTNVGSNALYMALGDVAGAGQAFSDGGIVASIVNGKNASQIIDSALAMNPTTALMSLGAVGQKYGQLSTAEGFDPLNIADAALSGAKEYVTENAFGFTDIASIAKAVENTGGNAAWRTFASIANLAIAGVEEGMEEVAGAPIENLIDTMFGLESDRGKPLFGDGGIFDMRELQDAFVNGAIPGLLMAGFSSCISVMDAYREGRTVSELYADVTDAANILPIRYRPSGVPDIRFCSVNDIQEYAGKVAQAIVKYTEDVESGSYQERTVTPAESGARSEVTYHSPTEQEMVGTTGIYLLQNARTPEELNIYYSKAAREADEKDQRALSGMYKYMSYLLTGEVRNPPTVEKKPVIPSYSVSNDGETRLKDGGKAIQIREVADSRNGTITLRTEDGEIVRADDVDFSDDDTAILFKAVSGMSKDAANAVLSGYNPDDGVSIQSYALGAQEAYQYGYYGIPAQEMSGDSFAAELTQQQRDHAYALGIEAGQADAESQQNAVEKKRAAGKAAGKVHFDGDRSTLSRRQEISLTALEKLSSTLGMDIYLFESKSDGKGGRIMPDGKPAPNGWYDQKDGSIHIDLNAGENGEGTILFTAAHELAHFIRAWSPAKFKVLADFLFAEYGKKGVSVDSLIREQIRKAARHNRTLSYMEAYEETVADSCETLLADGKAMEKLAKLKARDESLWQKIREFIRELAAKIRDVYDGMKPDSREGQYVAGMNDAMERLQDLFAEGLADAGENYQAGGAQKNTVRDGVTDDGLLFSRKRLSDQIDEVANQTFDKKNFVYYGSTPKTLSNILSIPVIPFLGTYDHAYSMALSKRQAIKEGRRITGLHFHALGWKIVKIIPQLLDNPSAIIKSTCDVNDSRFVVVTNRIDKTKNPIIIALSPKGKGKYFNLDLTSNILLSGYGKEKFQNYLAKAKTENRILWVDKKNHQKQGSPGVRFSNAILSGDYSKNLAQFQQIVKRELSGTIFENSGLPKFSLREPVEYTKDLVALHNLTEDKLAKALELGGFPMPSIAVTKSDIPHTNFGDITIIFGKETIDPKVSKKNTVYSADAWTPTFPQVEYEEDRTVGNRISGRLDGISKRVDEFFRHDLRMVYTDIEGNLNRYGGEEGLIQHAMENYGLKAAYLEEQGKHIEQVTAQAEADLGFNPESTEKYRKIMEILGVSDADAIGNLNLKETKEKYGAELEKAFPGITKSPFRMSRIFGQIQKYLNNKDAVPVYKTVTDASATKKSVDDALDMDGFEAWTRNLFSGIEKDSGVYNQKDIFTPSGNRRSFQQTHLPFTLDNIVKAMAAQNGGNTKNVAGFNGIKTLRAGTAERFKSIEDIHKAEGRLQNLTEEQLQKVQDSLQSRLFSVMEAIDKENGRRGETNSLIRFDSIGEIIMEISEGGKYNVADIQSVFRKYRREISDDTALEVKQLLYDVSQMPVNIFEAKPERAVRFDEVKAVILPQGTDQQIVDGLTNIGVPVQFYESGNNDDRRQIVNSMDNLKFSERERLSPDKYNRLIRKKPIRVSKQEWAMIRAQRKTEYSRYEESDIPVIDFFRIGDYRIPNNGFVYCIRNRGADDFSVIMKTRIVPGTKTTKKEDVKNDTGNSHESTDSDAGREGSKRRPDRGGSERAGNGREFSENDRGDYTDEASNENMRPRNGDPDSGTGLKQSERNGEESVSDRSILIHALESADLSEADRNRLEIYRKKVESYNKQEEELSRLRAELKEASFAKGPRNKARIRNLQEEAQRTANRLNIYDRQLLRLEATAPLQKLVEREKDAIRKRTAQRYQEMRKKNVEGRKKTAMKQKIRKITRDINRLFTRGTKEKNVKDWIREPVGEALKLADAVMSDMTAEEILRLDIVTTDEETQYIGRYLELADRRAELMESKGTLSEQEKAELEAVESEIRMLEKKNLNGVLERERKRLTETKVADVAKNLASAYEGLKNDPRAAGAYDDAVLQAIRKFQQDMGEIRESGMSYGQLERFYEVLRMIRQTIRNADEAFKMKRGETISEMGKKTVREIRSAGNTKAMEWKTAAFFKDKLLWNNLKPVYAFRLIGSETLTELYQNLRDGEDTWAKDMNEARSVYADAAKKYHLNQWNMENEYRFQAENGEEFRLTLNQMLTLYAYSHRQQAMQHLTDGGFVFTDDFEVKKKKHGIPVAYKLKDSRTRRISEQTLGTISAQLTQEQKEFADRLQRYLSIDMSDKGNEVSLALYGVKLFKEENYFPIQSSGEYMAEPVTGDAAQVKVKNAGFTKETQINARNPVVLRGFTEMWGEHVNEMALYHSLVLPMEDFNRVFNYVEKATDNTEEVSVKSALHSAYGDRAEKYIRRLLEDVNGGVRADPLTGIMNLLVGKFKKAAVFASGSVVIQQPSAIFRASAILDTKYFATFPGITHHKQLWEELKKYAPVAVIKEMGYFDTNMGRSSVDWLTAQEYESRREKTAALVKDADYRDEVLSRGAALADELSWCYIWNAVKKETAENHKELSEQSEAFLQMAGKRFTEIVTRTQVYDSIFSRSPNMRSKDSGMKMMTAFMAEPTTSINMYADAVLMAKRGNWKGAARTVGAVIASGILNAILVSLVYAARDDDENKTYLEKYVSTLIPELLESLNPIAMIPLLKDIWSILEGYDVERSDMAIISDLFTAYQKLGNDNVSAWRKVEDFGGAIASLFGLPLKNVMRDIRAAYNVILSAMSGRETTLAGFTGSLEEGWREGLFMFFKAKSNGQLLYEAVMDGDADAIRWIGSRFKSSDAADSALRRALRENDPRIRKAAEAKARGDLQEMGNIVREIEAENHFALDDILDAVTAECNQIQDSGETSEEDNSNYTYSNMMEDIISVYSLRDVNWALENGKTEEAKAAIEDIIQAKREDDKTKTRQEAENEIKSSLNSYWKKPYLDAWQNRDEEEMKRIRTLLYDTGLYSADKLAETVQGWIKGIAEEGYYEGQYSEADVTAIMGEFYDDDTVSEYIQQWNSYVETGTEYSDIQDRYLAGEISDSDAAELYQKYGGMKQDEAEEKVQKMACERDTGIKYDDIQKEYVSGNLTEAQAGEMLSTYGGVKDSDRADTLKKWQCEKDTGVKYDDIRESYIDGDITESKAREMLVKYGGKKQEEAEKMVREYQCEKDTGITYDEIREAYTDGEISRNNAISMWTKYGDMDREDAESKADLADFVKDNPEMEDISDGAVQKYNESCRKAGISASTFYNTWKFKNENSSDYDSNGKTTVSLWDKVTQYIDKQRLSSSQKDALYCAFYSSSTLYKTPWH